jgi:glycosyltransferase involved in cell wall biosynthesis
LMSNKIKMLFYGDAPSCATGFATISKNVLPMLHATGNYEISVMGVNYWGEPTPYQKMFEMYPLKTMSKVADPYGRQVAAELMRDLQYDLLFMIQDSFIMNFMEGAIPQLRSHGKTAPVIMYYPIDGVPKQEWVKAMSTADVPITYTEFGRKESIKAHPSIKDKLLVIPHGVNQYDFHPVPQEEVNNFRKNFFIGAADKFIITNLNRNQQRKDIPRTMMVFKEFKKIRPNSVLYLHMAAQDFGWDIHNLAKAIGLRIDQDVLLPKNFGPNQGYPVEIVNLIYNASDVIVSTTTGEGWGLAATEAMACKKPLIVPDNTSLREIVGEDRGFLVKSGADLNDWVVMSNDFEVLRPLVDIDDMVEKLVKVYDDRESAAKRAENGYKWVHSTLLWDKHIVPQWDSVFKRALEKNKRKVVVDTSKAKTVISGDEL